jgi:hypothetical protein
VPPTLSFALLLGALTATAVQAAEPAAIARYRVTFEASWSAASHPTDFPANAHFSPLIGGVHDGSHHFFRAGELATLGIELMAERGDNEVLTDEVEAAIGSGAARERIEGADLPVSPGSLETSFTASQLHPRVTLVTMVAPSPDWFVGVDSLPLFTGGAWARRRTATLYAWDAGTDSGSTYRTADIDTQPRQLVRPFFARPFDTGQPLGRFVFERLDAPATPTLDLLGGRFRVEVVWETAEGASEAGLPRSLSDETGAFSFFSQANLELIVKVIDGCALNQRYWVFAAGLTNVGVLLRVTDTQTDETWTFENPVGQAFPPVQDTNALTGCAG